MGAKDMQALLFLTQRIPYPPNKGDKTRSYSFLKYLCRRYRVFLGFFVDDPADWRHVPVVSEMATGVCAVPLDRRLGRLGSLTGLLTGNPLSLPYFHSRQMHRWVRKVVDDIRPSAGFVFSGPMAQYLLDGPRPPRLVMDFVDADSQKWAEYGAKEAGPLAMLHRREGRLLLEFERKVAGLFDSSLFVSEPEAALFRSLAPEVADRVQVIENGVDAEFFSPDDFPSPFTKPGPVAVFTGAMDYRPNIEAVRWFAVEVLPGLRQAIPSFQFAIVGSNPAPEVEALAALPGVLVTGRVPDVRPYLSHASVVVAPLLMARGIQNKVLEAMAMARPVVVSPQAAEGIDARNGVHFVVADGADQFIASVLRVFADPAGADRMGAEARRRVLGRYDWTPRLSQLERLLGQTELVGRPV